MWLTMDTLTMAKSGRPSEGKTEAGTALHMRVTKDFLRKIDVLRLQEGANGAIPSRAEMIRILVDRAIQDG